MSLTEATVVDVTFLITATFGEIPTGMVADAYGRRASMAIGAAVMGLSMLAWPIAPTVPLIVIAYAGMALGFTFLSGAEDALFYESLRATGRAGRAGAIATGALAMGSAASGFLATLDLIVPFLVGGLCVLAMLGIVLTLKEPQTEGHATGQARKPYGEVLRDALALMRARPALRYLNSGF